MVHYASPILSGLNNALSLGDGYSVTLQWFIAYPDNPANKIAYHIYYSTVGVPDANSSDPANPEGTVFSSGVKYVIIDGSVTANIIDLTPGQDYWFSVRPVEYDPTVINFLPELPISHDNVRFYPSSMLRTNMAATDLIVPLLDVSGFTPTGIVQVGIELIQYLAVDPVNNNLIVPPAGSGIPAHLALQINGLYYLPASTNVGQGSLAGFSLVSETEVNEFWRIVCVFVETDNMGNPIPGTAKFEAIGSSSGNPVDQYGNYPIWVANGPVVSNGILSFSVVETTTFQVGDLFTAQTVGGVLGVPGGRGFNNTPITMHTTAGFDGYNTWNPIVSEIAIEEDLRWDNIYACQVRFEYPNFPFTMVDGYKQVLTDILSTDLSAADAVNVEFPMYDFAGYHRTDPVQLLNGTCVGSYIGGEMGCIDAYGNYNIYRGLSLEDQNTQRQDVLLSVTGRPAVLIKRVQTGVTCSCYLSSSEYPDDRCPFCYGTKFVLGYQQYFNPRRSDGRILVRTGPTAENLKMHEAGLESEFPLDMWTLTVPTVKTRDVIILFDQDDNEEFRYEVSDVTRNNTILGLEGGQHFRTFRIRKFDPAYQIRVFRDTSDFPETLNTSLGFAVGLPPHSHTIQVNEKILSVSQINQTTGLAMGHNHEVVDGIVQEVLGHTHTIILP
jgi:hypothetical protein